MQEQLDRYTALDPRQVLVDVFVRLRFYGLALGVGELLDVLRVADEGWSDGSLAALQCTARLLWCKSSEDKRVLETEWNRAVAVLQSAGPGGSPQTAVGPTEREEPQLPTPDQPTAPLTLKSLAAEEMMPSWGAWPIQAPFIPTRVDAVPELYTYWPVSRRFMAYTWRYLRRPIPDGPADLLDIGATVDRAACQGFYLGPVYRRRERNHAHLVLLVDQDGSMTPFHHFSRDVIETARSDGSIAQVDVLYFHNVPADSLYLDPYLTDPYPLDDLLGQCSEDSSVLIVSDAGAARGHRRWERIHATTRFLNRLRRQTTSVAWLNPMPQDRWSGASAQILAHLLPMFQMDPDGFSNAIDVARGQPLSQ